MLAHEIMTKHVISVSPDHSVRDLARVLTEGGVSGAPVLDRSGELHGIVSEADVIGKRGTTVRELMRQPVVTATEDTPVEQICSLMAQHCINRVPVVREGTVVGIITRADIVRAMAEGHLQPDLRRPIAPEAAPVSATE